MATYLRKLSCDNSTINISFSSLNVNWNFSWSILEDPHGSDPFLVIISIKSDPPYRPNPSRKFTSSSPNKSRSLPQFDFNKANWKLFSQLVDSVIPNFSNNATDSVEKYNRFSQVLLDSAKTYQTE